MRDPLFQPIRVGALELRNRIVMPAMHLHMARDGHVTDAILAFYAERARGGAALVTVGYATVDGRSGTRAHVGAHRDDLVPGLRDLAATLHRHGARAAVQLNHAGRYARSAHLGGEQAVAPSAVPCRLTGETPRALDPGEIGGAIDAFAAAAARVKAAGFDAVELLCGTGYLVSQFLSPLTNRRTDGWGGTLDRRMRFGLEVARAIRAAVGPGFPILARVNGLEGMEGGSSGEELLTFACALAGEGIDLLGVNVGWHESRIPQITADVPRGAFAHLARAVKERVAIPVVASHRINDPGVARELLARGDCDLVAMGRALIADPLLPEKARTGREDAIVHCVACGQGCFDRIVAMKPVECLCNPAAGHELDRAAGCAPRAPRPLRLLVAGGGPAGMSAAIAAADRGHEVTLVERAARLGGQLHLAGRPPGRAELAGLATDLARQVALRGLRTILGTPAGAELLARERPDAVVIATGGRPASPPIPGASLPHVVQAWEVLAGRAVDADPIVVIGGGAVGVETALYLAERHAGAAIVVLEQAPELGGNLGRTTRWTMLQELARRGVTTRTGARVLGIAPGEVRVAAGGAEGLVAAAAVVLALGTSPHEPLSADARELGIPFRVAGDAARPATALEAIHEGFLVVQQIELEADSASPRPA